jgi:ubiquinone/menaquinone biosynthesis C-methylase UbiE
MDAEHADHAVQVAATSTGSALSEASYLDARFLAAQAEYEDMLRWAQISPSSQVLDAGSGSGAFLPLLCELTGAGGALTALDLAPENIAACQDLLSKLQPSCATATAVGSVLRLPFADQSFDFAWCANTSQYLADAELTTALAECQWVTKSGGRVALKEADVTCLQFAHIDPPVMWRSLVNASQTNVQVAGVLRAPQLPRWFHQGGFAHVRAKSFLIERRAPLRAVERIALGELTEFFVKSALATELPESDLAHWRRFLAALNDGSLFEGEGFFLREGAAVVVGDVL